MRKKYNTPHRSRVVKTRLSEDDTPTSQRGLRRLKIPQNIFSDFSKTVPLHTLFFSY